MSSSGGTDSSTANNDNGDYFQDSVISAHCFVKLHTPWCYGEVFIILCGLLTLTFSMWCLYRMLRYQNEAKSAVRSCIIYLSVALSLLSLLHALFLNGAALSLIAAFLVSFQCSLFTLFFIKICIRTNNDVLSISLECEHVIQFIFISAMGCIELAFFVWSLVRYDGNRINCHSLPFMLFSCVDVAQILCTIIAVYFIKRRLQRQHHEDRRGSFFQPLSERQQFGKLQLLQKSHQLLLLILMIFVCAVITAIYETWNFNNSENKDCATFIQDNTLVNEVLRLVVRISWLFVPSWLIINTFWIWPERPQKYVGESENDSHNHTALSLSRTPCGRLCGCCSKPSTVDNVDDFNYNPPAEYQERLRAEEEEKTHVHQQLRKASLTYHDNLEVDNKVVIPEQDDATSTDSGSDSDSFRQSDIWEQHITTPASSYCLSHPLNFS